MSDSKKKANASVHLDVSSRRHETSLLFGIYLVGFLDLAAIGVLLPFLPKHLESLGASPTLIGTFASLYGALQLISSPVVGKFSDIYGRRIILLISLLSSAVGYFLLGTSRNIWILFMLRLPTGICKHSLSLGKGCLADVTDEEKRPARLGHYSAISSAGFIVGPIIGGHAVAVGGFQLATTLTAFLFIINFIIAWFLIHLGTGDVTEAGDRVIAEGNQFKLIDAITFYKTPMWPKVSHLMTQRLVLSMGNIMFRGGFVLFLSHKFNTTPQENGYIQSFMAFLSTISSTQVGRISDWYTNKGMLMFHTCLLSVIAMVAVTFSPSLFFVCFSLVPLSFSTATLRVITAHLCIKLVLPTERGEVMGIGQSTISLARMIGPQLSGLVLEISNEATGFVGALFSLIGTGLVYRHTYKKDVGMKKSD